MMQNDVRIIGITGNSGSGKSLVSQILKSEGAYIINADNIAHEILNFNSSAYREVENSFGTEILNKDFTINRKALGKIVFADSQKLKILNSITHKYIIEEINLKLQTAVDDGIKLIIIDAPLLFETGLNQKVTEVWLIDAPMDLKLKRIMSRDNISCDEAALRLSSQGNINELKKLVDVFIYNNEDIGKLKKNICKELGKVQNG